MSASPALGVAEFPALGTGARILTTAESLAAAAAEIVARYVERIDEACSRFRSDSELARVNRRPGDWTGVSPVLGEALAVALRVARMTGGAVDPTVGAALGRLGYDRDFVLVVDGDGDVRLRPEPAPGWRTVELDERRGRVRIPRGVELDLGASAKALAADGAVARAAGALGCGVLVSLGGDVAVAGPPPPGGWAVLVTDHHAAGPDAPGEVVTVGDGGLATSSTTVRRWTRGGVTLHHILDPATGLPVAEHWRTVSVAASSCVDANAAATASVIWGARAPNWLARHHLPARLVDGRGEVVRVAGWPRPEDEG